MIRGQFDERNQIAGLALVLALRPRLMDRSCPESQPQTYGAGRSRSPECASEVVT